MKEGWSYKKLGEVCEVISGQSPEGKFYNTEGQGTPFYQGKKEFSSKYIGNPTTWTTVETKIAEKDDLLMSVRAPVGDINFATQRLCIGRGLAAIRTKEDIDKEYLFYFLVAKKSCIKGKEGVGFASINRKEIMDIDVQYPKDFSEQRSIVTRLDAAFSHIDALKANAEKQLNEARKLFQAELTECMKPKEGWEEKKLGEVFSSINNGANIKQMKGAKGFPITRIETLSNDNFNRDRMGYANIYNIQPYSSYILNDGDILMSHINSMKFLGRTVKYTKQNHEYIIHGMNLLRLVPKSNVLSDYMIYLFKTNYFKDQVLQISHQSVNQASFNITNLKGLNVIVPPLSDQHSIVSHLDSLSSTIRKLEELQQKTIAECDALKQAMLREVFE